MHLNWTKILSAAVALALLLIAVTLVAVGAAREDGAKTVREPRVQDVERLVIHYFGGGFELVSRIPLKKVLPPSVVLPAPRGQVRGTWFEVQDDAGRVIYRRRMPSPRIRYVEHLTSVEPTKLKREEIAVEERTLCMLVPAGRDAKVLVFFDSHADPAKRGEAASEIGRLSLR